MYYYKEYSWIIEQVILKAVTYYDLNFYFLILQKMSFTAHVLKLWYDIMNCIGPRLQILHNFISRSPLTEVWDAGFFPSPFLRQISLLKTSAISEMRLQRQFREGAGSPVKERAVLWRSGQSCEGAGNPVKVQAILSRSGQSCEGASNPVNERAILWRSRQSCEGAGNPVKEQAILWRSRQSSERGVSILSSTTWTQIMATVILLAFTGYVTGSRLVRVAYWDNNFLQVNFTVPVLLVLIMAVWLLTIWLLRQI